MRKLTLVLVAAAAIATALPAAGQILNAAGTCTGVATMLASENALGAYPHCADTTGLCGLAAG